MVVWNTSVLLQVSLRFLEHLVRLRELPADGALHRLLAGVGRCQLLQGVREASVAVTQLAGQSRNLTAKLSVAVGQISVT